VKFLEEVDLWRNGNSQ